MRSSDDASSSARASLLDVPFTRYVRSCSVAIRAVAFVRIASFTSMVPAKVGPPMTVAALVERLVLAQEQVASGDGQYAPSCERTVSRISGRTFGSDGSAKLCIVVFCPFTDRN